MRRRLAALLMVLCVSPSRVAANERRVFDFDAGSDEPRWQVINDGVMGGRSTSSVSTADGRLSFAGRVSLENNGGFASVRAASNDALDEAAATSSGVRLRVRGDGRTYRFTVRTDVAWYWASFAPKAGAWTEVAIPYARLVPHTNVGQPLNAAPFDGRRVDSFGFLVYNKRAERFRLDVDWIAFTS